MASPQLENGYVKIANEIMDALISHRIAGEQMMCLLFIIRKTYGFNKKEDSISNSQFVKSTGLNKSAVCRAINNLIDKNIVIKNDNKYIPSYRFNKNYNSWKQLTKKITVIKNDNSVIKNDNNLLSKKRPTKDNIKDNNTKDNIEYPDWLDMNLWKEFKKMRVKIKKPMTPHAEKLRINSLKAIIDKGHSQEDIVNKSISCSWQDFYEPQKSKGDEYI